MVWFFFIGLALPIMIIVAASSLADLVPMLISNLILGAFLGYTIFTWLYRNWFSAKKPPRLA